jgi:glycosyltransferase involved in cell wall biosynthesis
MAKCGQCTRTATDVERDASQIVYGHVASYKTDSILFLSIDKFLIEMNIFERNLRAYDDIMLRKVKVSVLMTVFNTDLSYTKRAIDSVLNQDFQDFELIIIDDGSKENNRDSLMDYVEKYEDKISYIRHSNRGQSESINRGVLFSLGEYIAIIDSDDQYKPNHLSTCLQEINELDLICSTTETIVDCDNDYYVPDKNDLTKLIHLDDVILFGTFFGRKNVFTSIDFKTRFSADSHFYEQASKLFRVSKLDLRTYVYHRNIPTSICATIKKANLVKA